MELDKVETPERVKDDICPTGNAISIEKSLQDLCTKLICQTMDALEEVEERQKNLIEEYCKGKGLERSRLHEAAGAIVDSVVDQMASAVDAFRSVAIEHWPDIPVNMTPGTPVVDSDEEVKLQQQIADVEKSIAEDNTKIKQAQLLLEGLQTQQVVLETGIPKLNDIVNTPGRVENKALQEAVLAIQSTGQMLREIKSCGQQPSRTSSQFPCTPQEVEAAIRSFKRKWMAIL